MNAFGHVIGRKVISIQRTDSEEDYDFYTPYSVIISVDQIEERLVLSILNDGSSVDVKFMSVQDIEEDFGLEWNEQWLNELKKDDELNYLNGERIAEIRLAEYLEQDIQGDGFTIAQGRLAGVELRTENHKILLRNTNGGWLEIDEKETDLPNPERWRWK
jgi:hypothetical protein